MFQGLLVYLSTAGCSWFENSRTWWMVWNAGLSIIGAAMARQISPNNVWARFFGYCLANAYSVNFPLTLAMSTGNIGGFTKKTTVNAMVSITSFILNFIGRFTGRNTNTLLDLHRILRWKYHRPASILRSRSTFIPIGVSRHADMLWNHLLYSHRSAFLSYLGK